MAETSAPPASAGLSIDSLLLAPNPAQYGPVTRRLLLRTGFGLLLIFAIGSYLALGQQDPALRAAGLSLVFPGGGFLYDAAPLLFVATLVAMGFAVLLWWGLSALFTIPLVWLVSVLASAWLADGPRLLADDGATWEKQPRLVTNVFQDPLRDHRWYGLDAGRPMLDDGAGFQRFDRSLPAGPEGQAAILLGGSDFVALASKTGVFYRTFCGVDDWTPVERRSSEGPGGTVSALAVDPEAWKSWLAADEKGIWRTEDVAKNWTLAADIH